MTLRSPLLFPFTSLFTVYSNRKVKYTKRFLLIYLRALQQHRHPVQHTILFISSHAATSHTGPGGPAARSPLKYILLDIDGVIWSGSHVIDRVPETLQYLRTQGKEIRFLSNNASLSREQLQQSFAKKGIDGVQTKECYNSAYAAALRIQQLLGTAEKEGEEALVHGNAFVIGEQGLHDELQRVLAPGFITYGIELHDAEKAGGYNKDLLGEAWRTPCMPAPQKRLVVCNGNTCRMIQAGTPNEEKISLLDLSPVAVVAGLDFHFSSLKLALATLSLQGPPASLRKDGEQRIDALFIATNEDPQLSVGKEGALLPGAGAMIAALRTSIGRDPDAVCGKPNVDMANILFAAEQIDNAKETCIMIGDRLTTDVAFGNGAGCQSMLVLSGIEGMADVEKAEAEGNAVMVPDYIADSLASLLPQ